MLSIGIGELQKNTSIFKNLTEVFQIVDKRKKEIIATVYPRTKNSIVDKLSGKYHNRIAKSDLSFNEIKDIAMIEAMGDKYGLSS